ncbi:PhnB protein, putative DNA binding protein 3-demethylubiquinone-9 3-methyltransferase domain protein [Roseibacterium elongatum DSM 19469]|uniref:PhnB protein, putative DNA binding protein 3-demethylubiquinone-9 3-methyltransferase domain protein n=1 Tax=Roseicyclus elongatus DSM 19469 TaxID=1294273 RepID=W8RPF3_9RHOB|nr:VOC family protein [Roseibacterium elongatum]AHM02893.1 PhnB protein, putative DNA binding protein 3-demethylubiquinone-9 3-methyltransferase domain protein [Roseibacterium elongatum DSM 19469]
MHVTPYLFFPGTCETALTFYAEMLGASPPEILRFADMPAEDRANMPGVADATVMNATLRHGDLEILASDGGPGDEAGMAGASLHLAMDSVAEAHRVFHALADGGEVGMPMGATFWTPAFGTVQDRFGIRWMVSVEEGVVA